jgi:hypothetical protein
MTSAHLTQFRAPGRRCSHIVLDDIVKALKKWKSAMIVICDM